MNHKHITLVFCLLFFMACLQDQTSAVDPVLLKKRQEFSPLAKGFRWEYQYTFQQGSVFSSTLDSGVRVISIVSATIKNDSVVYEGLVIDSIYSHTYRNFQDSTLNSIGQSVKRMSFWVTESDQGERLFKQEGEAGVDEMITCVLNPVVFPDSMIQRGEYESKPVDVVELASPHRKYVKGIGLVFFHQNTTHHPTSNLIYSRISGP